MAIITRFTLVAVFGVALIALATTSVVSADAASMGEEDHAMKTEQAADAGGGYMKAPGDKIQQPTDPGADIEATDAAAHGASPDEEEGKEEEEPDAAAHAHEEDAPAAEEKPEEEEGETEEGGDIVTEDKEEGADELVPLVETLSADPEFATLVAAVKVAVDAEGKKLPDDLAAEGPFTVFAPNNAAFTAYLAEVGKTPEEILVDVNLREILANHVVAGKFKAADVLAMDLPVEVPALGGAVIKIDKSTDGDVLVDGKKVVKPDIEASNGVIHGIDGIITGSAE